MHYFDWTATARPTDRAIDAANHAMREAWGNPSSTHALGTASAKLLASARRDVLTGLGQGRPAPGQLFFTSGGTEANNLAILGAAYAKARRGAVLISDGEHPSVEACAALLEADGFRVIRIPTRGGVLDTDAIRTVDTEIAVASFMLVNNETGALYDVATAAAAVRAHSPAAFIHTDAVQGFMKVRFTPEKLGVNAVTVSAHKIGGLKGCGALYVDSGSVKAKRIAPRAIGGGQESGLRSGTENMPGICAFGAAVTESLENFTDRSAHTEMLRRRLTDALSESGITVNTPPCAYAGIVSVTLPGVRSETMLNFASANGFCISAGSACSAHSKKKSTALAAFGLTEAEADSTVRISLSHLNTKDEADGLAAILLRAKAELFGLKNSLGGRK